MIYEGSWQLTAGAVKALGSDPLGGSALGNLLAWRGWAGMTAALAAVGLAVKSFLTTYFGDVARYVSAAPRNIKVRHEARQRGLRLLDELAATRAYERIVVVGHSLGSVLAHDLVMLAWSEAARAIPVIKAGTRLHQALRTCESAADRLLDVAGYRDDKTKFLRDDPARLATTGASPILNGCPRRSATTVTPSVCCSRPWPTHPSICEGSHERLG